MKLLIFKNNYYNYVIYSNFYGSKVRKSRCEDISVMASQSTKKNVNNEVHKCLVKSDPNKPKIDKRVQKSSKFDSQPKHPTKAFIEKSENEFKRLENKISDEFQKQLSNVFENEIFADTLIIRGKYQKKVHSCLLFARIPQLFDLLLDLNLNRTAFNSETNQYSVKVPPEIKEDELKNLLQKTYSECSADVMEDEEKNLISKIEILSKNFSEEEDLLLDKLKNNESDDALTVDLNLEFVTQSDEEETNDQNDDNDPDQTRPGHMIRSGTFELLTSIYSEDDLKVSEKPEENGLKEKVEESKQCDEKCEDKCDPICDKSMTSSVTSDKMSNSMFSMFIDINEPTDKPNDNRRPKSTREDISRKGFDFIPLDSKPANSKKLLANQRRPVNSAHAILMRSLDSAFPETNTRDDFELLPMSPIVRKKPEDEEKRTNDTTKPKNQRPNELIMDEFENQCPSSSDSFSEAFNECINISLPSSSKNSYESDSIDIIDEKETKKINNYIEDSDNDSFLSDDGNNGDNSDLDFNDSQNIRNLKSCSKLGEDLLRMFLQQINADIIIKVSDREIRAHKCILTSRCRYFEAMLSGNWVESESNYVDLQGFSYNSVYFALCHIYSGCLTLPSKIDLSELALLSDILAMDSLKEIVVHELLVNRCHFFHIPCSDNCINSIIKCMKLCSRSGLKDLYNRCLIWSAKHFTKVWNNKTFATLKPPIMDACLQTKVSQLQPDNVLKTTLECERMLAAMPRVKWAEPVFTLLGRLIEECCSFIASHYNTVITSKDFLALGRSNSWDISNLEETLLAAMTKLSPDISCKALIELNKILLLQESDQNSDGFSYGPFNDHFARLVTKMQRYCERFMIQNANRVVHCQSWLLLSSEVQQKIKDGAIIVFEFDKPLAPPPKLSSRFQKKTVDMSKREQTSNTSSPSKGAVPKNRSKIGCNARKGVTERAMSEQHIYDTVPFEEEPTTSSNIKAAANKRPESARREKVSNRALSLHLNSRQNKEKVAKVSPFSVKAQNFSDQNQDSTQIKDLVAEIDADTSLVTHCLHEAELLEQELARKLYKSHKVTDGKTPSTHQTSAKSAVRQPKEPAVRRTTSRTQSTSTPIKSRVLPKIQNQRK